MQAAYVVPDLEHDFVYAPYANITPENEKADVFYVESPAPVDPNLPKLRRPPWLVDYRAQARLSKQTPIVDAIPPHQTSPL
jgi:hypothetical protein